MTKYDLSACEFPFHHYNPRVFLVLAILHLFEPLPKPKLTMNNNHQPSPQCPNGFMMTQPPANGQGSAQPLVLAHQTLPSPNFGGQFMPQHMTIHQGVGPQAYPYHQSGVDGSQPATQAYPYNQPGVNGSQPATLSYPHNTSGLNGSHPAPLSLISFPQGQQPHQLVQCAQQAPVMGGFIPQAHILPQPQQMRPARQVQNRAARPVQKLSAPVQKPLQVAPSLTDRQLSAIHRSVLELIQISQANQRLNEKMLSVMTANKISEDLAGPKRRVYRNNRFEGKGPGAPGGRKGFSGRAKTVPPIGVVSVPVLAAPVKVLRALTPELGSDQAAPSTSSAAVPTPAAQEEVIVDDSIVEEDPAEKSLPAP